MEISGELIIKNLIPHLQAWWLPIKLIGYLVGFVMVAAGLASAVSKGRSGGLSTGHLTSSLVAGVLLVNLVSFVDAINQSLFAKASETGLTYSAPGGGDPTSLYITFAVYVVMLVGLAGVIYGGILLKRSADDGRQIGPAITHMVGGTIAVNIVTFLHTISSSMGDAVENAVARLIG